MSGAPPQHGATSPGDAASTRASRLTLAFVALALLVVGAGCAGLAYFAMFTTFGPLDDEGYVLIALRSYLEGARLYDDIFTQYGPFYFEAITAPFRLFSRPIDHDHARLFALFLWAATAALLGAFTWRTTRSPALAVAVELLAFLRLGRTIREPLHPGGLLVLLLALLLLATTLPADSTRARRGRALLLGALTAAITLCKINVGAFAAIALAFVFARDLSVPGARLLRAAVTALFVAVPPLLMVKLFGRESVATYAWAVSASAAGVAWVARHVGASSPKDGGGERAAVAFVLGALVLSAGAASLPLLRGASLGAMVDAVFLRALRHPGVFHTPVFFPSVTPVLSGLGLLGALFVARCARPSTPRHSAFGVGLQLALGLGAFGSVVLETDEWTFALCLPLLFAVVVEDRARSEAERVVRLALAAVAVLQALHAYPVAGSQLDWSTVLFLPAGAMALGDGLRGAQALLSPRWAVLSGRSAAQLRALGAVTGLVALGAITFARYAPQARLYAAVEPLGLRGASRLHLGPEITTTLRWLVERLEGCSTFYTLPGMNSLHLLSGVDPPNAMNTTTWMTLFDAPTQQHIVDQLEASPRPCAVRNTALIRFWMNGRHLPGDGPLERYLEAHFRVAEERDGYELLEPATRRSRMGP